MSRVERDYLRGRLLEERERVVAAVARLGERAVVADQHAELDHSAAPFHATREIDSYNQALDALEITRLTRELAQIEHALKLLQEKPEQFGLDERTGKAIPFDELKRVPWVRTSQLRARERDLLAADPDVLRAYRNERYAG